MMNKLFMIVLSVCCLLMAACGTDNDETPQGFRIVDTDVDLVAGGGTVEVALQAAGELTAVSGADWCRVIEVTNEKITLLARANYEYVSRATQVTVSWLSEQFSFFKLRKHVMPHRLVIFLRPIPTNRFCGLAMLLHKPWCGSTARSISR